MFGMLVSELRDDCRPSSLKNPATFLYGVPLLVLAFEFDVWLLSVVALVAIEGRRSPLRKPASGESLPPVSGRKECESWRLGGPSLKRLLEAKPWVDNDGRLSSIQGAISALGASVEGGRLETDGIAPLPESCWG